MKPAKFAEAAKLRPGDRVEQIEYRGRTVGGRVVARRRWPANEHQPARLGLVVEIEDGKIIAVHWDDEQEEGKS